MGTSKKTFNTYCPCCRETVDFDTEYIFMNRFRDALFFMCEKCDAIFFTDFSCNILKDNEFAKKEYANYKLQLTVRLNGSSNNERTSYIIYTNAKIDPSMIEEVSQKN